MVPLGPVCVGGARAARVKVWLALQRRVPLALTVATNHSYVCPGVSAVVDCQEVLLELMSLLRTT